jgi:hypothetical protein
LTKEFHDEAVWLNEFNFYLQRKKMLSALPEQNEIPNPSNAHVLSPIAGHNLNPHPIPPKKEPPVLATKGSGECSTFLLCAWQHAAYFEMVWG